MKNAFYDPSNDRIVIAAGMFDLDDNILKFVLAHEIAHGKLGHANSRAAVSYATTGAMFVLNAFVPGTGYLNHLVNPAVTNNYSKTQETEADLAAYNACLCMGMTKEDIISALRTLQTNVQSQGGGFWEKHPSWDDRIADIQNAP